MPLEVLLVEDSPGDVRLTQEAFYAVNPGVHLNVAADGVEALAFLRHEGIFADAPRPDLTLLDLNMPRMDGRQVLALIKTDDSLKSIPIVILTTSESEGDVAKSYQLHAQLLSLQARAVERLRDPGEKYQRLLADQWPGCRKYIRRPFASRLLSTMMRISRLSHNLGRRHFSRALEES